MKVLFICKGNWFRSQMAAAIYNTLTATKDADSAGTYTGSPDEPEGRVISEAMKSPCFFEVMEKHGMYIRNNKSKKLLPKMLAEYSTVISMAEEPYIPDFLRKNKKVIWWDVENPDHITKMIAEDIYEKVYKLVYELINR